MIDKKTKDDLKGYCAICGTVTPRLKSKFCSEKCFKEYRTIYHRELMRKRKGYKHYKKEFNKFIVVSNYLSSGTNNVDFSQFYL